MTEKEMCNVLIIGGGIAAHSAAVYTSRASLKPLVLHGPDLDQLSLTTLVENYPGFPDGVMGPDLVENAKKQAQKFGAKYEKGLVQSVKKIKGGFEVKTKDKSYKAKSVIIATGAAARKLGVKGEDIYFGRGVSTCAVCDAALYEDKEVVVIGGGDSAMEETLALYKFAKKITIIHRRDEFKASQIMQDRVMKLKDKVNFIWNSEVVEVLGEGKFVSGVKVKDNKGKISEIKCQGVFLAVGHIPSTKFVEGLVEMDKGGYIITDKFSRTNIEGIYACGDCQDSKFKQAITSAGTGCQCALQAEWYIEGLE
jgi:thioredoxin reductase (NADPH)